MAPRPVSETLERRFPVTEAARLGDSRTFRRVWLGAVALWIHAA